MNLDALLVGIIFLVIGGIANMTPVLVKKLAVLNLPVDGGKTWRGKRILGEGKTWRGIFFGIVASGLAGIVLAFMLGTLFRLESVNFVLVFGVSSYIGMCALIGDLAKSFIKRQMGIERGYSWFPFDQLDWVLGIVLGLALASWLIPFQAEFLLLLPIGIIVHLVVKFIGYKLKIEDKAI